MVLGFIKIWQFLHAIQIREVSVRKLLIQQFLWNAIDTGEEV